MKDIKNVLICGIGAVGSIYANKINEYDSNCLKVLVDKKRLENYTKSPKIFNGKPLNFNYILPENNDYKADLIIIATKFDALNDVIKNIKNFVKEDTIIMSLLNGVTSEEIIAQEYGWTHTLLSYFIGHSAMRTGNNITYDGIGKIVFGIKENAGTNIEDVQTVKNFFDKANIVYEIPNDMHRALWLKYMLNVSSNQPSAILKMTFGQMQSNSKFLEFLKKETSTDQTKKTNYIKDPELKYMQRMPNNCFSILSITQKIDGIFNWICLKINKAIGSHIGLKFFLRRTLGGCEFGVCLNFNLKNNKNDDHHFRILITRKSI